MEDSSDMVDIGTKGIKGEAFKIKTRKLFGYLPNPGVPPNQSFLAVISALHMTMFVMLVLFLFV